MEKIKVPEECADIFDSYMSYIQCRDESIQSFFSYKRAAYYGKLAVKERRRFWKSVREVFPELVDKELSYDHEKCVLEFNVDGDS